MNVFARRNAVSFRDPADKYSVDENYAVAAAEHSSTDTETEEEGKAVAMEDSAYTYSTTSILRRDFGSQMTPVKREKTTCSASLSMSLSVSLSLCLSVSLSLSLQRCALCQTAFYSFPPLLLSKYATGDGWRRKRRRRMPSTPIVPGICPPRPTRPLEQR